MTKNRDVLVVGGGIAGLQAALLLAEKDRRVHVVDRAPAVGGFFPLLDRQFPTNSCGVCFMSPKPPALCPIYEGSFHPNIRLHVNCDITDLKGAAGDFEAHVTRRPTFVDPARCNLCGVCVKVCPVETAAGFGGGLEKRKAIYLPFPQAMPRAYVIDPAACTRCGKCVTACPSRAVNLDAKEERSTLKAGAVILGFGFEPFKAAIKTEFGFGRYRNVLTSIQYERLLSASGPTLGVPRRPSDGKKPRRVAFLQCVGSRDRACGQEFCSSVCCMYATKQAMLTHDRIGDAASTVFYMDLRSFGKNYERYCNKAQADYGVHYQRCAVSSIKERKRSGNLLVIFGTDDGNIHEEEFDLVVLSVGFTAPPDITAIARRLDIRLNEYQYCHTDEMNPVATSRPGVFVAGAFREPRDIPETVVEASAAAAEAALLLDDFSLRPSGLPVMAVDDAGLRVGIVLCDRRGEMAAALDMAALTATAKADPHVRFVERIDVTDPAAGAAAIALRMTGVDINRIVLAGFSGPELERRLKAAGRGAGVANYIESVNLGEQCAGVHGDDARGGRAKAVGLLMAAIAKVSAAAPAPCAAQDLQSGGLVIGGGITGMTSALTLAGQGIDVTLVEKEPALGGLARTAYYTLKGADLQALLKDLLNRIGTSPRIKVLTGTELTALTGAMGNFTATLTAGGTATEVKAGAVIIATGGREHRPSTYLYGTHPAVVTQRELDGMISRDRQRVTAAGAVVMIQCVGSRDKAHPYCSRVCCTHAVKNALKVKELNPAAQVYILYRDIRTYGFFEKYYLAARDKGVLFIRYEPETAPEVTRQGAGVSVSLYDHMAKEQVHLAADLLVLSAGVEPAGIAGLAKAAGVDLDADGFLKEANPKAAPLDARDRGKFFAGLAHSPMLVEEALCQGKAAAERAAVMLWQRREFLPETQSVVKPLVCTRCGQCVAVCPYHALSLDPQIGIARVDTALCRGCGSCAGTCRVQAIDIRGYGDLQLLDQVDRVMMK